MNEKEYNGYTNYETWLVALWIDNEPALLDDVEGMAERAENKHELADEIEQYIEEMKPETVGLWADLMNAALSEVDWSDIAENYYDEAHPEEEESEQTESTPTSPATVQA